MKTKANQFQKWNFTLLKKVFVLFAFVFVASCSKDDEATPEVLAPLQDPLPGYILSAGFNQNTVSEVNFLFSLEQGFSFIPLVKGKMTAIVVKLPDFRTDLRITIWDKATSTVLRSELMDINSTNLDVTKQITPINLEKDKEYFITMNTNDFYTRSKTGFATVTYPFTVGDIKITSFSAIQGTDQIMPTAPNFTRYSGDCSFKFQK